MARDAIQLRVRPYDLETHHEVIESRGLPSHRRMAGLASLREIQRDVVRIRGLLEIRQVARYAGDAGKLRVIERRSRPAIDAVTYRAIGRKLRGHMVRSLSLLKLLRVAGIAIRREPLELPRRSALVTGIALHHRVRTDQRKTVLVILNGADVRLPPLDRVAGFAIRAHLAAMNIRMAVRAFGANICKHRLGMTRRARNIRVQATQRILRLAVIKFRNRANRLPSNRRVAVLARNRERCTMRTARALTGGTVHCRR